jgi:hypothetical protein
MHTKVLYVPERIVDEVCSALFTKKVRNALNWVLQNEYGLAPLPNPPLGPNRKPFYPRIVYLFQQQPRLSEPVWWPQSWSG